MEVSLSGWITFTYHFAQCSYFSPQNKCSSSSSKIFRKCRWEEWRPENQFRRLRLNKWRMKNIWEDTEIFQLTLKHPEHWTEAMNTNWDAAIFNLCKMFLPVFSSKWAIKRNGNKLPQENGKHTLLRCFCYGNCLWPTAHGSKQPVGAAPVKVTWQTSKSCCSELELCSFRIRSEKRQTCSETNPGLTSNVTFLELQALPFFKCKEKHFFEIMSYNLFTMLQHWSVLIQLTVLFLLHSSTFLNNH